MHYRKPALLRLVAATLVAGATKALGRHRAPRRPRRGRLNGVSRKPSIVLVLTDDLSMNPVCSMPHVLTTLRRGLTFTNHFVSDSRLPVPRVNLCRQASARHLGSTATSAPRAASRPSIAAARTTAHSPSRCTTAATRRRGWGKFLGYLQALGQRADGSTANLARPYVPGRSANGTWPAGATPSSTERFNENRTLL